MVLEEFYGLQVPKMFFYHLLKLFHLPYMLRPTSNGQRFHSMTKVLDASRQMIKCYQKLREGSVSTLFICDSMDFQVFTATVVLVIGLFSSDPAEQEVEDRGLIDGVRHHFKRLSDRMECVVATQAGQVLEYLTKAGKGCIQIRTRTKRPSPILQECV